MRKGGLFQTERDLKLFANSRDLALFQDFMSSLFVGKAIHFKHLACGSYRWSDQQPPPHKFGLLNSMVETLGIFFGSPRN